MNGNSHVINSHSQSHSIPNAKYLTDNANNAENSHHHAKTSTTSKMPTTSMTTTTRSNFVGNKMRNNVGHKASQMRRIQLSTAAKRCKSMDNNNPKTINCSDPNNKALPTTTTTDDDDTEGSHQTNASDAHSSTSQSIGPRKLVKVKTWYTQSSHDVQLPATFTLHEQEPQLP